MDDEREWVSALDESFGRRVRERRLRTGLSQNAVSLAMTVDHGFQWHQTTVAKTEAGERPVRLAEAAALAVVINVPLIALIHGEEHDGSVREHTLAADRELVAMQTYIADRRRQLELERHGVSPDEVVSLDGLGLDDGGSYSLDDLAERETALKARRARGVTDDGDSAQG